MPLTKRMRVREATAADMEAIRAIARSNGDADYQWPAGAWGAVAVLDDRVVAFCAGRDVTRGCLIEDMWQVHDADGLRGLAALSSWVEEQVHLAAVRLGQALNVGGFVFPHNTSHRDALIHRGYHKHADVYAKRIEP